jgi:hypothetical protein
MANLYPATSSYQQLESEAPDVYYTSKTYHLATVPLTEHSSAGSAFVYLSSVLVMVLSFLLVGHIYLFRLLYAAPELVIPHGQVDNIMMTIIAAMGLVASVIGFMGARTSFNLHIRAYSKVFLTSLFLTCLNVVGLAVYLC